MLMIFMLMYLLMLLLLKLELLQEWEEGEQGDQRQQCLAPGRVPKLWGKRPSGLGAFGGLNEIYVNL